MKKYNVFISANQKELKKERLAAKEIIINNEALRGFFNVFLFEDLSASGRHPVSAYLNQVDKSDIYIGIIGNEYGAKGKDGLSATEREYRRFIKKNTQGEPLIFIKGRNDLKKDKNIRKLITSVRKSHIYKRFANIDNLKTQILNSLISYLDERGKLNKLPFDETLSREADYNAISEREVKDFLINRAVKHKVDIPKISIKDFLINTLKVVKKEGKKLIPTNACLLFFGKNPSEFIPQSEIRIARFRGTTRTEFIDSKEINGPVYKMIDEVEAFFKRNTRLAGKIVEFKRIDIPEYPFEAVREAVINTIAHRDYTRRGAPIIISIFDDRIEISNPGGLLPGLKIKKLEGHHLTRNKKVCSIFHETKDMERFGTGIGKMKRLMKAHGLPEPELSEEGDFFVAKFSGPGDKILDLVPNIPEDRQVDLKELGLNERQIEALRLMVNEKEIFTNRKFRKIFKVTNKTASTDLNMLIKAGMIQTKGRGRSVEYLAK